MKRNLVALVLVLIGCSDDRPPAAAGGTTQGPPAGGNGNTNPGTGGGGNTDAGVTEPTAPFDPEICANASLFGEPLEERGVRGTPPVPSGGPLVVGNYVLAEMYKDVGPGSPGGDGEQTPLPGTGPTGYWADKTLVIGNGGFALVESDGTSKKNLSEAAVFGGTYKVSGTALVLKPRCPAEQSERSIGYFASGRSITLFRDGGRREIYQRQP